MPQARKYPTNSARQAAYRRRLAKTLRQELADPRLPSLPAVSSMPGTVRWNTVLRRCTDLLALIRDEMASYYDARSQAWQEGDRGEAHTERVDALTGLVDSLEELSF